MPPPAAAININGDTNPNEIDFGPNSLNFDTITVNNTNDAPGIRITDFAGIANLGVVTLNTNSGVALTVHDGGTVKTLPGSTINATIEQAISALNVDFGTGSLHFDSVSGNAFGIPTVDLLNTSGRVNIMGGSIAANFVGPEQGIRILDSPSTLELILHNTTVSKSDPGAQMLAQFDGTGSLCLSMAGNTFTGAGTGISLVQGAPGAISVVQQDAATLSVLNGGVAVSETGAITYGQGCLTAPMPGDPFSTQPDAVDDPGGAPLVVDEGALGAFLDIDVLANDTDADIATDGDVISLVSVTTPTNGGTAMIISPTTIRFTGDTPIFMDEVDTFMYTITDKAGLMDTATVTVNVTDLPEPPVITTSPLNMETVGNTRLDVSAPPPLTAETPGVSADGPVLPARSRGGSRSAAAAATAEPKFHGGIPGVQVSGTLTSLAGISDPDSGFTFSVPVPSPGNTTLGGIVTITDAMTGAFTYDPPANCPAGPDSFTYTINDGTTPVMGMVSIALSDCIWFVDNSHTPNGTGTSADPFNKLSDGAGDSNADDGEDASSDSEDIFVLFGDGTTTNQDSGITLNNDQRLIGEGVELTARNPFTLPASGPPSQTLFPAGNKPLIGGGGSNDVSIQATAGDRLGMEVRGLTMTGTGINGIEVVVGGTFNAEVLIANNQFGTAALQVDENGIRAFNAGTGTWTLAINGNSFVNVGFDGMNLSGPGFVTSLSNNVFDGLSSGVGVTMDGVEMTNVTFDANPSDADFTGDTVPAGGTSIGVAGTPVGMSGMLLTNVSGDVNFGLASGVLDIFATDAGLQANGTGPIDAGAGMGFRITVPDGSTIAGNGAVLAPPLTEAPTAQPKLVAALGGAMDLDPLTAMFGTSGGSGVTLLGESVSFFQIEGDLFFSSASALTGGTGDVFSLTGSDASIDYDGTIVDDTGFGITIGGNGTAANNDTVNFNGTVALGVGAALADAALQMTDNDPTFTVNFTAPLDIVTSGAHGIFGRGSGKLTTVAGSSVDTTDGTAINIDGDNTNLIHFGAGSLNFDTVAVSNANSHSGIIIVDFTGTANLGVVALTTSDGTALSLSNGGKVTTLPGSTITTINGRAILAQDVDFGAGSLHFNTVNSTPTTAGVSGVSFTNTSGSANIMGGTIGAGTGGTAVVAAIPDQLSFELVLSGAMVGTGGFAASAGSAGQLSSVCLSLLGNTIAAGIALTQTPDGTLSVVQGSSAILSAVNGGAGVTEMGAISYGAGCLTGGGPFGTAPTALDDAAMVDEDMTVSINVIDGSAGGLDTDPDMGDIISIRGIATPPTMGTATITSPTNVLYDYTGPFLGLGNSFMDSFVYEITDKAGNFVTAQVTVTVNGVAVPPNTAADDDYETAGNTLLDVAAAPAASGTAKVDVTGSLCSNDTDGGGGLSIAQVNGTTDGGGGDLEPAAGTIEVATAGSGRARVTTATCELAYAPPADSGAAGNGAATTSDSFTYEVVNGTGAAMVNIGFVNQVWYVDNSHTPDGIGTNNGTSPDPFASIATLVAAGAVVGANDTIFVYDGISSTTTTDYTGPITIDDDGQRLIGEGVALTIPDSLTQQTVPVPGPQTLLAAGTHPQIDSTTNDVDVTPTGGTFGGIEVKGIHGIGSTHAINVSATSTDNVEVLIANNMIGATTGPTMHGLNASNTGNRRPRDRLQHQHGQHGRRERRQHRRGRCRTNLCHQLRKQQLRGRWRCDRRAGQRRGDDRSHLRC